MRFITMTHFRVHFSLLFMASCLCASSCDSGKPATSSGSKATGAQSGDSSSSAATPIGTNPSTPQAQPTKPPPLDWYGEGVIEGVVKLATPLPPGRPFQVTADPTCAKLNAGKPVLPPEREVGKDGGLPHVFVYVRHGISGKYSPPAQPVILNQQSCMYVPHVLGVMCGQMLEIRNGDPTVHNVHALAKKNDGFNIAQANLNAVAQKKFDTPEVMMKIKCDVHSWMSAYVGILSHPFYAVTSADGAFRISRLPPGKYTVEARHELLGVLTQDVIVPVSGAEPIVFTFKKGS